MQETDNTLRGDRYKKNVNRKRSLVIFIAGVLNLEGYYRKYDIFKGQIKLKYENSNYRYR
jgi:hypothetical protein